MIFKPKISHQKPIKPPLKADFNAYFTKKRMIFTPIYKICATPKGPFRVRFPAGVPSKKEPSGSFLLGFWCGNQPAVRSIAQQWHERRKTHDRKEDEKISSSFELFCFGLPFYLFCNQISKIWSYFPAFQFPHKLLKRNFTCNSLFPV